MLQDPSKKYRAFPPVGLKDRTWPDTVLAKAPRWASIDLRDGNQALVEPMNVERKLRMFETLVAIGFKEIEVGYPSASKVEFDFVRKLIEENRIPDDVTIQVLTPARAELIDRTFEALNGAARAIVHMYNAVAPIMREVVFHQDMDGMVKLATEHIQLIRQRVAEHPETHWTLEYSPEMFSDTELEFSLRIVDAVTDVWQPTPEHKCIINLPSTVERCTPNVYADMIEWMHRRMKRRDSIVLSIHPHNDRGTGVASAEFALMAGADRLEGCLFGNGERTGNLDLVNVALNLYTQGVAPHLDFSHIDDIRTTVEYCNQIPIHPRHPYVGDLVYTSFSGSHQDAIKKAFAASPEGVWNMPYLPIDPRDVGRTYDAVIRVNSQSGKGGISYLLESEHGLALPRRLQIEFSQAVQRVMDVQGKELTGEDLWRIFGDEYHLNAEKALRRHSIEAVHNEGAAAKVIMRGELEWHGKRLQIEGSGNGPIDAFNHALSTATAHDIRIIDYHQHAIGDGADAQSVAYVEMRVDGSKALFGVGVEADTTAAAFKAVVSGLRRAEESGMTKAPAAVRKARMATV